MNAFWRDINVAKVVEASVDGEHGRDRRFEWISDHFEVIGYAVVFVFNVRINTMRGCEDRVAVDQCPAAYRTRLD